MYTNAQELMEWEDSLLSEVDEILLFSKLVKTGMVWNLQGTYGRNAINMINSGILSKDGSVLVNLEEYYG